LDIWGLYNHFLQPCFPLCYHNRQHASSVLETNVCSVFWWWDYDCISVCKPTYSNSVEMLYTQWSAALTSALLLSNNEAGVPATSTVRKRYFSGLRFRQLEDLGNRSLKRDCFTAASCCRVWA